MLYVVNRYRYLTRHPQEALEILREIEATSRVPVTGIVNNSNLGSQTTAQDIENAIGYGLDVAALAGVPVRTVTARRDLASQMTSHPVYPVDIYVLPPWEK